MKENNTKRWKNYYVAFIHLKKSEASASTYGLLFWEWTKVSSKSKTKTFRLTFTEIVVRELVPNH